MSKKRLLIDVQGGGSRFEVRIFDGPQPFLQCFEVTWTARFDPTAQAELMHAINSLLPNAGENPELGVSLVHEMRKQHLHLDPDTGRIAPFPPEAE